MAINRVFLVGNVTADCKVHKKGNEINCITFTLAVDDRRYNRETEKYDNVPGFYQCAVFGKRAAGLAGMIVKGLRCAIEGHLRYTVYGEGDDRRSSVSVIVDEFEFMQAKEGSKTDKVRESVSKYEQEEIPF